jgi:hypothetical protein
MWNYRKASDWIAYLAQFNMGRTYRTHEEMSNIYNILVRTTEEWVRGSLIGQGAMLQALRSRVKIPIRSLDFSNLPNHSSRTMILRFTQPLTEISTTSQRVRGLRVKRLWPWPPSVSWLSRKYGILNVSEPCVSPRPGTGIALLFFANEGKRQLWGHLNLYGKIILKTVLMNRVSL